MRNFADVILILLLISFGWVADFDWEKHLAFGAAFVLSLVKLSELYNRRVKVVVRHTTDYPDPDEYRQEYEVIEATYTRGEKSITFNLAGFYCYYHNDKGAVCEAWNYHNIKLETLDSRSPQTQIGFDPDAVGNYIIGCALHDVKGKWHYSKGLTRKERRAHFEPKPERATKPPPLDGQPPFPF